MIQGRHKNDIPSVVTLGRRDGSFTDASGGMTESGDAKEGDFRGSLVSDTLTLIKGGDICLLMAFLEGHRYFCSSRIRPEAGEGDLLAAGCQPGVLLMDSQSLAGEPFVLRTGSSWQALAEAWAAEKGRALGGGRKTKNTPSVFCT